MVKLPITRSPLDTDREPLRCPHGFIAYSTVCAGTQTPNPKTRIQLWCTRVLMWPTCAWEWHGGNCLLLAPKRAGTEVPGCHPALQSCTSKLLGREQNWGRPSQADTIVQHHGGNGLHLPHGIPGAPFHKTGMTTREKSSTLTVPKLELELGNTVRSQRALSTPNPGQIELDVPGSSLNCFLALCDCPA